MTKKELMSVEEENRLGELEAIIQKDLKGFIRVGMALKEIRKSRLYRGKYTSWKDYLKTEWDMGKRIGDYQIKAFDIVENIKNGVHNCAHLETKTTEQNSSDIIDILPRNEAQVRPLALLPPVQQRIAWQKVINRSESKPTALIVRKVVEEMTGQNIDKGIEDLKAEAKTREGVPDDFNEAYNLMVNVVAKHRKLGWKGIKRKEVLRLINALTSYFE